MHRLTTPHVVIVIVSDVFFFFAIFPSVFRESLNLRALAYRNVYPIHESSRAALVAVPLVLVLYRSLFRTLPGALNLQTNNLVRQVSLSSGKRPLFCLVLSASPVCLHSFLHAVCVFFSEVVFTMRGRWNRRRANTGRKFRRIF